MNLTMPSVLQWVLGGNADKFVEERAPHCLVGDKPRLFGEEAFARFLTDDDALVRATQVGFESWCVAGRRAGVVGALHIVHHTHDPHGSS